MRKWVKSLSTVILLGVSILGSAETVEELSSKGHQAYAEFRNEIALDCFRQAYKLDPDNYDVLKMLISSCNNVGEDSKNKEEAEKYFIEASQFARELVKKYPDKAEAYFYLAVTDGNLSLYRSGRGKAEAGRNIEKNAKKAIALDPEFAPSYVVLGIFYREVANLSWYTRTLAKTLGGGLPDGTMEKSEEMLRLAIAKSPTEIYPHYQLAVTLEMADKKAEALEQYRQVIKLPIADHQDQEKQEISATKIKELTNGQ